jgi:hypothetical protein
MTDTPDKTLMNKIRSFLQTPIERALVARMVNEVFRPEWREMRRLQKAGKRVPNTLWWRRDRPVTSHPFLLTGMCLMYIVIGVSTLVRFDTIIAPTHTLGRIFFRDFLWLSMWTVLPMMTLKLCQILFDPKWLRLWNIRWMRSYLPSKRRREGKSYLSTTLAIRRIAMLLGVVLYLPLLFAAAGIGNMPAELTNFSVAIGNARIAPLFLLPLAIELNIVMKPFRSRTAR